MRYNKIDWPLTAWQPDLDADGDDDLVVPGGVGPAVGQEQGGAHDVSPLKHQDGND